MSGLGMMLKALGIKFTEEHVRQIELLIPQIPAKLNEAGSVVNAALLNFDGRLKTLEAQCEQVSGKIDHLLRLYLESREEQKVNGRDNSDSEPGPTGATKPAHARRTDTQ